MPKNVESERESEGIHLIVFVHGFQGNSFDMRLIKNYVSFLYP
jgi:esterase/lipase